MPLPCDWRVVAAEDPDPAAELLKPRTWNDIWDTVRPLTVMSAFAGYASPRPLLPCWIQKLGRLSRLSAGLLSAFELRPRNRRCAVAKK